MGRSFVVPWRIRDPFFVLLCSTLAFIALFVFWAGLLGVQAKLQGIVSSAAEWKEAFKDLSSSSPWLDLFLLLQSFLMLWFARAFLLRPWSVGFKQFVVPGQGALDARAAMRLFFVCILASVAIVAGILILLTGVGRLLGHDPAQMVQTYQQGMRRESRSLMGTDFGFFRIVPLVFIGPPIEELLYRGCLYGALRKRFAPWQANVISSSVFALSHGYFFGFPNVLLLGILAAGSYERTGSLRTPVLFHILWNAFCLACVKPVFWIALLGALIVLVVYGRRAARS